MKLVVQPLTAEAFSPFGELFTAPDTPQRGAAVSNIENRRHNAKPTLSMTCDAPVVLPVEISKLESHPYSSQAFLPIDLSRFLIVVAPSSVDGTPILEEARAFIGNRMQAFNYNVNVWHCGFMGLDQLTRYAVLIWRTGSEDEVFFDLPSPITIVEE